jgi:hypothetical protein
MASFPLSQEALHLRKLELKVTVLIDGLLHHGLLDDYAVRQHANITYLLENFKPLDEISYLEPISDPETRSCAPRSPPQGTIDHLYILLDAVSHLSDRMREDLAAYSSPSAYAKKLFGYLASVKAICTAPYSDLRAPPPPALSQPQPRTPGGVGDIRRPATPVPGMRQLLRGAPLDWNGWLKGDEVERYCRT